LKIGSSDDSKHADDIEHGRAGLLAVLWGSIASAAFALIIETQIFASDVVQNFRIGKKGAVSGYDFSLSFLLLGIGHLVGLSVGIAMLIGLLIGFPISAAKSATAPPQGAGQKGAAKGHEAGGIDPRILPAVRFRWELNGFTLVTTCG